MRETARYRYSILEQGHRTRMASLRQTRLDLLNKGYYSYN